MEKTNHRPCTRCADGIDSKFDSMKIKTFILTICIFLPSLNANSQITENLTPGLRFGPDISGTMLAFSARKQVDDFKTAELLVGLVTGGLKITVLAAQHEENLADEDGLSWYAGVGSHMYLLSGVTAFGLDGQLGIEYDIPDSKLTASLDYKPTYELDAGGFYWNGGGLSLRYNLDN